MSQQKYIYDLYLKSNNQEAGIMTYNKVSNFIIDYYQREELLQKESASLFLQHC